MSKIQQKAVSVFMLMIVMGSILLMSEPAIFEAYAEVVYDREVDFKTVNADLALLSSVVEYEDIEVEKSHKDRKMDAEKIRNENIPGDQKAEKLKKAEKETKLSKLQKELEQKPGDVKILKKIASLMKVKVDRAKMKKTKVAKRSVETYAQMLEFQNEMTEDPENIYTLTPDPKKYPELVKFWEESAEIAKSGEEYVPTRSDSSMLVSPWKVEAIVGLGIIHEIRARAECGYYGNYKPHGQIYNVAWKVSNKANAKATLISWGYHETYISAFRASVYDYTRAQTFTPEYCGWNTFRDHAAFEIVDYNWVNQYPNNYWNMPYRIVEQNYHGWNPRGEPNPEVYISGPWPYPDWVVYVWHYHKIFTAPYTINKY